jgi:hypothetical protein
VVASGKAACFVSASMGVDGDGHTVTYVEVEGIAPSELAFVWKGRQAAPTRALISAVGGLLSGPGDHDR